MSGALVIESMVRGMQVEKWLGDTTNRRYYEYSIMKEMENYPKREPVEVIIDCGTEDLLIEMNRTVHRKLLSLRIPHEYTERPGRHDWRYWSTAIQFQLLFFHNYFSRSKTNDAAK